MMMYPADNSDKTPVETIRSMLKEILGRKLADGVLVAATTPWSQLPMPTLFNDPAKMDGVDPLAPAAPVSCARQAASLTRNPTGKSIVLVLRPCEIRAMIELVKLNQCSLANTIIVSMECLGRM